MELEQRYRIHSFLSWSEIEGETVAVDSQEGKVYRFNSLGAEIWKALDGQTTVSEIIERVKLRYESKEDKIRKDVLKFLNELFESDLITKDPA